MFEYSSANIDAIAKTLSSERFEGYLQRALGDRQVAVRLYEKNAAMSEALYSVVQGLEIPLRNSIHDLIATAFGQAWYIRPGFLYHPQDLMVAEAQKNIRRNGRDITCGRVVAELSFGFWTGLVGKQYEQTLWVPHLHRAFPNATTTMVSSDQTSKVVKLKRSQIADRLDSIRKLRNRIAHHEPIIDLPLQERYLEIIQAITWICPTTAAWIDASTSFRYSANNNA